MPDEQLKTVLENSASTVMHYLQFCIDPYGNRNSLITSEIDNIWIILVWISNQIVCLKSLNRPYSLSNRKLTNFKMYIKRSKMARKLVVWKYSTSNHSRPTKWITILKVQHIDLHLKMGWFFAWWVSSQSYFKTYTFKFYRESYWYVRLKFINTCVENFSGF